MAFTLEAGQYGAKVWQHQEDVEPGALEQIRNVASLPIIAGRLALMPDIHVGVGATIGSVIPTRQAVIPSAVGVDIGCGVSYIPTSLTRKALPEDLTALRPEIERGVPTGFHSHRDEYLFQDAALEARKQALRASFPQLAVRGDWEKVVRQIGTLGGGNHYIELVFDENGDVGVFLHSGSRNLGKVLADHHIKVAQACCADVGYVFPDPSLAWLTEGTPEFEAYRHDMVWALEYAMLNRAAMTELVLKALWHYFGRLGVEVRQVGERVNIHHNYVEFDYQPGLHITRKGATSARLGELGLIPGSMGTKSYITRGLGNEESFCSSSHGAGRRMSRAAARKTFTVEDLRAQTLGVNCALGEDYLDESPGSYKDLDVVMAHQTDLVEILHTLKQVLCIKGADSPRKKRGGR